jgi:hypothetical protein
MLYCFLSFVLACMYVYVLDHVLALRSCVDAEPLDEYQEPQSSEQFEQQQENFEEGKYNMNILSLVNTISYCILILYAYKDFLATLSFIYTPWVAFWLVVLGAVLSHTSVLFN